MTLLVLYWRKKVRTEELVFETQLAVVSRRPQIPHHAKTWGWELTEYAASRGFSVVAGLVLDFLPFKIWADESWCVLKKILCLSSWCYSVKHFSCLFYLSKRCMCQYRMICERKNLFLVSRSKKQFAATFSVDENSENLWRYFFQCIVLWKSKMGLILVYMWQPSFKIYCHF